MAVDREFYVYRFGRPRPGRADGGGRRTDGRTDGGRTDGGRKGGRTEGRTDGRAEAGRTGGGGRTEGARAGGRKGGPTGGRRPGRARTDGRTGGHVPAAGTILNDSTTIFIDFHKKLQKTFCFSVVSRPAEAQVPIFTAQMKKASKKKLKNIVFF